MRDILSMLGEIGFITGIVTYIYYKCYIENNEEGER